MKTIIALLLCLVAITAYAIPTGYKTPSLYNAIVGNDTDIATNVTNIATNVTNIATNLATLKERVQIAHYQLDATVTIAAGAIDTGIDIPAGSIIKQVYLYPVVQIVSANDNTIAVHCESANDLYTATDLTDTAAGTVIAGVIAYNAAESAYLYSDGCDLTVTVGAGASGLTAGKLDIVVEYIDL